MRLLFCASFLALAGLSNSQGGGTNPDINVLLIERTPRIAFNSSDTSYSSGLPALGQAVVYKAHVKNWGAATVQVPYEWRFDGIPILFGTVGVPAGQTAKVDYPWNWDPNDHTLEFVADPGNTLSEFSKLNNRVEIRTNALLVGLWVEQSLYNYFHANQWVFGDGANGFEDWGQRMVRRWNDIMSFSTIPRNPLGVRDRMALDKVVVVPDNALPLNGGIESNNPDSSDRTVDMMWGYPYNLADVQPGAWWRIASDGPFYLDHGSIHEMNHARYMIDNYGFDVHQSQASVPEADRNIQIRDDINALVAGTQLMPFVAWEAVHYNKYSDVMGGPSVVDVYTGMVWNWKHHKRGRGNMNAPADIGVYLQQLPQNNHLRLIDQSGKPLAGATVDLYRATSNSSWYGKKYDNVADLSYTADAEGWVHMPRNPFSTSTITHTYGLANGVAILKVRYGGQLYFAFLDVTDFNIQYWLGRTQDAFYNLQVDLRSGTTVPTTAWRANYFDGAELTGYATSREEANLDFNVIQPPFTPSGSTWSGHWIRDVQFTEGWKQFTVTASGGVTLTIDGRTLLDEWDNTGLKTWTFRTYTESGSVKAIPGRTAPQPQRRVEVRFKGAVGSQNRLVVNWAEGSSEKPVPTGAYRAEFYRHTNLTGYQTSRLEDAIDRRYGSGGTGAADPTLWGSWSTRWTGDFEFAPSQYRFTADLSGGVRASLGGVAKLNKWGQTGTSVWTFDSAADGLQRVMVEFTAPGSSPRIKFSWQRIARTLSGKVLFGDRSSALPTSAALEFRRPGQTVAFETKTVALGADGSFSMSDAPSAIVDVSVKQGTWLRRTLRLDLTNGNLSGAQFSLINGDVDGDNSVTVFDYGILSDAFDSSEGSSNWDARADLDGDGSVTVFDYGILSDNFDKTGDE